MALSVLEKHIIEAIDTILDIFSIKYIPHKMSIDELARNLITSMNGMHIADHKEGDFEVKKQCDRCGHFSDNDVLDIFWTYDEYKHELSKCNDALKKELRDAWCNFRARALSRDLFTSDDGF